MVKSVKYRIYSKLIEKLCLQINDDFTSVDVHTTVMCEVHDKIAFMMASMRLMPVDPEKPWATSPD